MTLPQKTEAADEKGETETGTASESKNGDDIGGEIN